MKRTVLFAILGLVFLGAPAAPPLHAQAKKPITHDVYDSWKSIQGTKLSSDGVWLAYALTPQDGDGELVVRNLKTSAEIRAARGREPLITQDGRLVVFAVAPLKKDVDAGRKAKRKPEDMPKAGVGIVNLQTSQVTTVAEHVKSFRVPDAPAPQVVVYLTAAEPPPSGAAGAANGRPRSKKVFGTDLVIRDLATGAQTVVPEVNEYAITKNGAWVAYGVSSKTPANEGAFARAVANGVRKRVECLIRVHGRCRVAKPFPFSRGQSREHRAAQQRVLEQTVHVGADHEAVRTHTSIRASVDGERWRVRAADSLPHVNLVAVERAGRVGR